MKLNLTNKIVLVTGSTYGIGYYIAKSYLEEGSKVIITSSKTRNILKAKKNLKKYINSKMVFFEKVDFKKYNQILNLKKKLNNNNINIDILINNLGTGKGSDKDFPTKKDLLSSLDINFISAYETTRLFINDLIKNNGNIIFISSIASLEILPAPIEYSISKTAINTFSKILSNKYGSKVRVNTVIPGNILVDKNNWWKKLEKNKKETMSYIKKNVPQNKFGSSDDIANLVKFISSEKAKFINGASIVIDGGQTKRL